MGLGIGGSTWGRQLLRDCARATAPGDGQDPSWTFLSSVIDGVSKKVVEKGEVCNSGMTRLLSYHDCDFQVDHHGPSLSLDISSAALAANSWLPVVFWLRFLMGPV